MFRVSGYENDIMEYSTIKYSRLTGCISAILIKKSRDAETYILLSSSSSLVGVDQLYFKADPVYCLLADLICYQVLLLDDYNCTAKHIMI